MLLTTVYSVVSNKEVRTWLKKAVLSIFEN
nr:MAG TPA: Tetrahydrodipicolinate N-succinyltransferase N-terminal [Caudoviricetes sp.]DAW98880.1 MAG TPA: Tetrahydrodipicolinate N-succinyltransferase N-terminal [Bacteriophage sp.]